MFLMDLVSLEMILTEFQNNFQRVWTKSVHTKWVMTDPWAVWLKWFNFMQGLQSKWQFILFGNTVLLHIVCNSQTMDHQKHMPSAVNQSELFCFFPEPKFMTINASHNFLHEVLCPFSSCTLYSTNSYTMQNKQNKNKSDANRNKCLFDTWSNNND